MGSSWVFFLSHIASGFQLWFYFHLCMWVVHWGLLLGLPWKTWVCPCEDQVWRWCCCLGRRGSGSTSYSGELVARAAGNIVLWKGMATSIGQYAPVSLPGEPPSLTEKPGSTKCAGTWTASTAGVTALSESFFKPLAAGDQQACLASLSP